MTTTLNDRPKITERRPVAGYILASIGVGVVGLVTAILITVSGIMNPFSDVSESYVDIFDTGIEVDSQLTPVDLDDAKYTIVSFSDSAQTPSVAELNQQCDIIDPHGDPVATNTASQRIADADRARFGRDLVDVESIGFTHFEARSGTYTVSCAQFGLLSDGSSYTMGSTATKGVLIGLGSVVLAGGLFVLGVVNSSRNKKAQAENFSEKQR